jgi:hypothetical protein
MMANLQNLKPFPKGKSGNPKGRQPDIDLKTCIREALQAPSATSESYLSEIVCKLISMSLKGNIRAAELIFAYAYGKPKPEEPESVLCEVILPKPLWSKNDDDND